MIPTQTNLELYPEFGNNASKVMPDDTKYTNGFVQSDVLPAEWMNWAWSKNTKGITALNSGVKSMEEELNALVQEAGNTPTAADSTQVKTSVLQLINNVTGTLSDLATSVKTTLVAAINSHVNRTDNPHSVTKSQVGLGNCDNTADANKSVNYSASAGGTRTLAQNGTSHGTSWLMTAQYNRVGDQCFRVFCGDGSVATSVNYSDNSGAIEGKNFAALTAVLCPIGSVMQFAGSSAPGGFLICNGAAISRTTFAALFSVIGVTYGAGDGSTTFNIPDFREFAPVGIGQSDKGGITSHDVYTLGQRKDDQAQGHYHYLNGDYKNRGAGYNYGFTGRYQGDLGSGLSDGFFGAVRATGMVNDGTNGDPRYGNVTRGKRLGINFIIKY